MDTPNIMHNNKHSDGYSIEMEHQCSERKSSPSVVAHFMGLEEMVDNSTLTSQRIGALYMIQSKDNYAFRIFLEVGN